MVSIQNEVKLEIDLKFIYICFFIIRESVKKVGVLYNYFNSFFSLSKSRDGIDRSSTNVIAHEEIVASLKTRIFQLEDEVCCCCVVVVVVCCVSVFVFTVLLHHYLVCVTELSSIYSVYFQTKYFFFAPWNAERHFIQWLFDSLYLLISFSFFLFLLIFLKILNWILNFFIFFWRGGGWFFKLK